MFRRLWSLLVALPLTVTALTVPMVVAPSGPATAAASGSIVYILNHNVHIARPDGTGARALTSDGTPASPWRSPDQASNGTVVAARGPMVHRMDQWGTVLNSFDPPDAVDNAGSRIGGTVTRTAISGDGSKIAYTFHHHTCPSSGCRDRWVTAISAADRFTEGHQYAYAYHDNPTWISNSQLLVNGIEYDGIHVHTVGSGERYWFDDSKNVPPFPSTKRIADPALSADGTLLATVRSDPSDPANHWIVLYTVTGDVRSSTMPVRPVPACYYDGGGEFGSPSFSPDNTAMVWHESDGIWRLDSPTECDDPSILIPGGREPSWSPAPVQTARPTYAFARGAKPRISGKPIVGKRLAATPGTWTPAPERIRYQWLRNGRTIKGATKPTYKVARADQRRKLVVRVIVERTGLQAATAESRKVRVRKRR